MHLFRAGAGKTGMGLEIIGCRWLVLLTLLLGCGETSGGSSPAKARPHVVLRQNEGSWIVSGLGTFAAKEGLKTVGFSWRAETKEWHLPLLEGEGGRGGGGGGRGRGGLGGRGGVGSRAAFKMIRDNVKRVCAEHGVRLAPIERGASGLAGSPAKLGSLSSSKKRARMRPEMVRDDEWMAIVDQDLNPGESMKVDLHKPQEPLCKSTANATLVTLLHHHGVGNRVCGCLGVGCSPLPHSYAGPCHVSVLQRLLH